MQGYTPQPQPQQPGQWPQQQYPPQQQYYPQQPVQQQYYPPQQGMQPPMQQQPPMQPPKPKKNMMLIAIIAIVVVVIVILAAVLLMSGAGTAGNSTAESAARSIYDAVNKYDSKAVLELSIDHYASSIVRSSEWSILNSTCSVYDSMYKLKIKVSSVSVESQVQMTPSEQSDAESIIDNLIYTHQMNSTIVASIADYSKVTASYTYTMNNINIPYTVTSEALMLKIEGKWYAYEPLNLLTFSF